MKIYLDPGHGGRDPGAIGNGLAEKDLVLDLALGLGEALAAYQCEVSLSRTKDTELDIPARVKAANAWGADFYFSLHVNGHNNAAANGYEDYISTGAFPVTVEVRRTIHAWLGRVWERALRRNRGMKVADYQVLRETRMPAVLVENGFISNAQDAALLRQHRFRADLVSAMTRGIVLAFGLKKKQREAMTPILGKAQITIGQAQEWSRSRNAHQRFRDIAPLYWLLGKRFNIRPEVAFCQAAKETALGSYGGAVRPEQHNWAGIKLATATGDRPEDHESFANPTAGVRAHYNHLAAYVGVEPLGKPHGRYYVVKGLNWAGTIRYVEELGGRWAPDSDYGRSIVRDYMAGLLAVEHPKG
jgi:hypothetical protein